MVERRARSFVKQRPSAGRPKGRVALSPLGGVGAKPTREHRIRLRSQQLERLQFPWPRGFRSSKKMPGRIGRRPGKVMSASKRENGSGRPPERSLWGAALTGAPNRARVNYEPSDLREPDRCLGSWVREKGPAFCWRGQARVTLRSAREESSVPRIFPTRGGGIGSGGSPTVPAAERGRL